MIYKIKLGPERKPVYNRIELSFAPVLRLISGNELKKVQLMTLPLGAADKEATVELVECEHCIKHGYAIIPTPFGTIYHDAEGTEQTFLTSGYHEVIIDTLAKEVVIL